MAEKIYASFNTYKDSVAEWTAISEQAMLDVRKL